MKGVAVLAYHAVSPFPNHLCVDVAALRHQLRVMLGKRLRPVTFSEAVLGVAPTGTFAVTFDDGFRSVFDRARPILAELGVPATVFLPTSQIGTDRPVCWPGLTPQPMPPEELLPMTWEQVRQLASDGWEVGSHTVSHPRLTHLDDQRLKNELVESKEWCEAEVGAPCRVLAYPFGDADPRVVQAAADAGYLGAVTMGRQSFAGPLAVPRIGVYSRDSRHRFALKVSRPGQTKSAMAALTFLHHVR